MVLTSNAKWLEHLPLILLELRTLVKRDMDCSAAEVLYGNTLHLPAQYFFHAPEKVWDVTSFVDRLTKNMAKMAYSPSGENKSIKTYVSKALEKCKQVFVRDTARSHSLQPPYRDPFKVTKKCNKFFSVLIKDEEQNISIDRLKPATLEDAYLEVAPSHWMPVELTLEKCLKEKKTRSGKQVKWPAHLRNFVSK